MKSFTIVRLSFRVRFPREDASVRYGKVSIALQMRLRPGADSDWDSRASLGKRLPSA